MMSTHRATWVLGLLALAALAIAGGVAQASIRDSQAGGRAAIGESQTAERAALRSYRLEGDQQAPTGGKVELFVHVRKTNQDKKFVPTYIGAMFAYNTGMNCDEGPYPATSTFGTQGDFKINSDGRFSFTFTDFVANFAGKVTKQGRKAVGTVSFGPQDRYHAATDTTYHNCTLPNPVKFVATPKAATD